MARTAATPRGTRTANEAPKLGPKEFRGRNGKILKYRPSHMTSFDVPEHLREPDWTYQWQAYTIYGEPAPDLVDMLANGWDYVQSNTDIGRYFSASSNDAGHIVVRGLVLMERPRELTQMYIDEAAEATKAQYRGMMDKSADLQLPSGFTGGDRWAVKDVSREHVDIGREFGISRSDDLPDED